MNLCTKCSIQLQSNDDQIQCLLCQLWTHLSCATFTGDDEDSFYLCDQCEKIQILKNELYLSSEDQSQPRYRENSGPSRDYIHVRGLSQLPPEPSGLSSLGISHSPHGAPNNPSHPPPESRDVFPPGSLHSPHGSSQILRYEHCLSSEDSSQPRHGETIGPSIKVPSLDQLSPEPSALSVLGLSRSPHGAPNDPSHPPPEPHDVSATGSLRSPHGASIHPSQPPAELARVSYLGSLRSPHVTSIDTADTAKQSDPAMQLVDLQKKLIDGNGAVILSQQEDMPFVLFDELMVEVAEVSVISENIDVLEQKGDLIVGDKEPLSKVSGNSYKIHDGLSDKNNNGLKVHKHGDGDNGKPIQNKVNNEQSNMGSVKANAKSYNKDANKKKTESKKTLYQQKELGDIYFSTHITSETNIEYDHTVYTCQSCNQFKSINKLEAKKHALNHEKLATSGNPKRKPPKKNKEPKWACDICDFKSIKKSDLKRHAKKAHPTDPNYNCSHCPLSFMNRKDMKRHIRTVHFKIKRKFCDLCDYKCRDSYDLKMHKIKKHTPTDKVPNTVIEGTSVNTNPNYESKKKPNKIDTEYLHKCNECGKGFSDQGKLNRHLKLHTGVNLPKCDLCGKTARDNYNLQKHMRGKHNTVTTRFSCNFCKKTFSREITLVNHLNKFHADFFNAENVNKDSLNVVMDIVNEGDVPIEDEYLPDLAMNDHGLLDTGQENIKNHNKSFIYEDTIDKYLDVSTFAIGEQFDIPIDIPVSVCNNPNECIDPVLAVDFQLYNVSESELDKTQIEDECDIPENIICDFCNHIFSQNYNLLRHIDEVHNLDEIKCKKCNSTFCGKQYFLNHRPCKWSCTKCNKVFVRYRSFIYHVNNIHSN